MSTPVAIINGAASGIGLALTRHLLNLNWRVVMADINSPRGRELEKELGGSVIFIETDVSSWDAQVALFSRAYEWGNHRLDFLASNAGVADEKNLVEGLEIHAGQLKRPDLTPIDVNLLGSIYATQLFAHYVQKSGRGKGKIVITSSGAGLYAMISHPVYCVSKHGLIGLTRAVGPTFKNAYNIAVNCILPSFVVTGITIPPLVAVIPKQYITPMETMLKAFDTFLDDTEGKTGQVFDVSIDKLHFRETPSYIDETQKWLVEDSTEYFAKAFGQAI